MHPVLFQIGSLVVPSYGALAALGLLVALGLAQGTARRVGLNARHGWNLVVLAALAGLAVERLLLILLNLSDLRRHPVWLLALAMVHHPLLAAAGMAGGGGAVLLYARWARLSLRSVGDCLTLPLSMGLAVEQVGALMAGSDFGRDSDGGWAVTYTSELAARWSGTPLGVALVPVQVYAALGWLLLAAICAAVLWLPRLSRLRRAGDLAGIWLIGAGTLLTVTEMFRDWEGRGALLRGAVDSPQLVGLGLVLLGGVVLGEWKLLSAGPKG